MSELHSSEQSGECLHSVLRFGSGDYYLICQDCMRYWVMCSRSEDRGCPELSNIGLASTLSGQLRKAETP